MYNLRDYPMSPYLLQTVGGQVDFDSWGILGTKTASYMLSASLMSVALVLVKGSLDNQLMVYGSILLVTISILMVLASWLKSNLSIGSAVQSIMPD